MEIQAGDDGSLVLEGIPALLFQMLLQLGEAPSSAHPGVEARLYPDPSQESELVDDWKSLVQPGLQQAFLSARETVQADLRAASGGDEADRCLRIPAKHFDAWLSALNQARLSLAAVNDFGERDLAAEVRPDPSDPRSVALFQIGFWGFLQECLIRMQD